MEQREEITITELFAGADVFVTGGSGFMGKVLLEKLLHSCPDIRRIFVLLRPKKGKSVQQRIDDIIQVKLFEPLRNKYPEAYKKLVPIEGDCAEIGFGISAQDTATLTENVSIFFHVAASVRFDDPIKKAVLLNTRGTREALELAKKMKYLSVFQYVSTTYCYTREKIIQETVYPARHDWQTVIQMAEREDSINVMEAISNKLLESHPNTYTFSKSLAEQVVQHYKHEVPVVIFRPAVVINSFKDPFPGWIDNLNGPFGLWAGAAKGVLRYLYGDFNVTLAYTPVDWAIRAMIQIAWARATGIRTAETEDEIEVVHLEATKYDRMTFGEEYQIFMKSLNACSNGIRYPRLSLTRCYYYYWLAVVISHLHYGFIIDCLLRLAGQKPRLLAVYRKIFIVNEALAPFLLNEYPIETRNIETIDEVMCKSDREEFSSMDWTKVSTLEYKQKHVLKGVFEHVLKEPYTPMEAERHLTRLWILEKVHYVVWISGLAWISSRVLFF